MATSPIRHKWFYKFRPPHYHNLVLESAGMKDTAVSCSNTPVERLSPADCLWLNQLVVKVLSRPSVISCGDGSCVCVRKRAVQRPCTVHYSMRPRLQSCVCLCLWVHYDCADYVIRQILVFVWLLRFLFNFVNYSVVLK